MNVLWYYAIGFVVVWVLAFLLKGKYNITINGIVLMLKTDKLEQLISKIASISPRFWKALMNMSIPLGLFFMAVMVISLIISLQLMFETPTVSLILPGVDVPGSPIYVPFFTGFVALATVLVIHEGGHGVLARAEGVSIDSVGLLLALVIPGAFVEPNEDEIKKLNAFGRIRIYFAGPMFNIGLCLIALVITAGIGGFMASENLYTSDGMEITSVVPGSPSDGVLEQGMVISKINSVSVSNYSAYTAYLNTTHIGDRLNISTDRGDYLITTRANPNNDSLSYMGIRSSQHQVVSDSAKDTYGEIIPMILPTINEIFYYIFFLNFAVGTFNLLPMKPLDGGLILEEILKVKIRPDRRTDFNNSLNGYTRLLPRSIRCWISRRFNDLLNFIHSHELSDEKAERIATWISQIFLAVLIILVLYGFAPAIRSLL
ncbi:MAG: site-2 protease family protein [Methanosphaera sp.]|nr:site-2 protease family protein [Methanosphaera sp.]